MTRITIKNFQSIKEFDFTINGFTVIIGTNNLGKSALIRAVEAALTNQTGNKFIKKGEKETQVTLDLNNLNLKWKKNQTSATYTIKGIKESFSKLKGAVPQPIIDAGFNKIDIGDQKIIPCIAAQFEPLFLINKPGSVIAEVLASLYQIDTLSKADDLCQKELKSQKTLLKTRESDLKTVQKKIEKFKDFENLKKQVNEIIKKDSEIQILKKEITEISLYENHLETLTQNLTHLSKIKKIKIPDESQCETLVPEVRWLQEKSWSYNNTLEIITKLKNITLIKIPDESQCDILLPEMNWLREKNRNYDELLKITTRLKNISKVKIPDIFDTETLLQEENLIKQWDITYISLSKKINLWEKNIKSINIDHNKIEEFSQILDEFIYIKKIENQFTTLIQSTKTTREQCNSIKEQLEKVEKEKKKIKICPLCERPFNTERIK